MRTLLRLPSLIVYCCLCAACSDRAAKAPEPRSQETANAQSGETPDAQEPLPDANVSREKLTAGGIPSKYAAHYDGKQLVKIDEQRMPTSGATLNGEYTFEGGRLMRYRGAKVAAPAELDLQFDLRGGLQSGGGPDVSDDDITTIRTRAQLLRSHALAHRDIGEH